VDSQNKKERVFEDPSSAEAQRRREEDFSYGDGLAENQRCVSICTSFDKMQLIPFLPGHEAYPIYLFIEAIDLEDRCAPMGWQMHLPLTIP
jgi:hypothetical protein